MDCYAIIRVRYEARDADHAQAELTTMVQALAQGWGDADVVDAGQGEGDGSYTLTPEVGE